ncbi:MAG: galactose-1-phosphate uridylyltransferase [Christensenellales bacterium]
MLEISQVQTKLNELVAYAIDNLNLKSEDEYYVLNQLLDLFKLQSPGQAITEYGDFQTEIVDPLVNYAVDSGLIEPEQTILFETKLLGLVTPMPSAVVEEFDSVASSQDVKAATDWLFELSKANNYIRMPDINKNIKWEHKGKLGRIDVTINLSKPEKDPRQIALAKLQPKSGYPACMLCPSNVGYAGHINHPARQTLRIIPIELGGEEWNLQFSPYQYYHQHVIAFSSEHRPMKVNDKAFGRLMDFVDLFPHYFIGSNAALPIVGGSILTHDHYQGGEKVLPMFLAKNRRVYRSQEFPDVELSIVDWYNSVVRIEGKNRKQVYEAACKVLTTWEDWSDESVGVICKTDEQHNAITPIVRLENKKYVFDLILRNNRTDEAHPFGIFHPEESLHNIKKEGIGIIEVMGLFILPGRLKKELEGVKEYLTGKTQLDLKELSDPQNPLCKHAGMIVQLVNDNGVKNTAKKADAIVNDYVNKACEQILECTGVFKNDEAGQTAFDKFMTQGLSLERA